MKFKEPKNANYTAIVVEIKTLVELENCDNVQAAIILNNQVIVDKKVNVGDKGLFFTLENQLSKEFMKANNLYRDKDLNSDPEAKPGYFDENGRIRCQKFRKNDSEGFYIPIDSINFTGVNPEELNIGDEFDELNGIEICRKYVVKNSRTPGAPGSKKDRTDMNKKMEDKLVEKQFKFHEETNLLFKYPNRIKPDTIVHISYKEHGCVSAETIINTLQGDFTIKDIVDNKLDVDVKAFDINTGNIVYVPIDEYYLLEDDGDWYEIELEDGTKLNITGNNPVWLPELSCYRKTSDLKIDDILLVEK